MNKKEFSRDISRVCWISALTISLIGIFGILLFPEYTGLGEFKMLALVVLSLLFVVMLFVYPYTGDLE